MGRLKEPHLKAAEAEYIKRLRAYCKLELRELKTAEALEKSIDRRAFVIALDERGETPSSTELAHDVFGRERLHGGGRPIVLAIGGADGHPKSLRDRADYVLSFGRLTIAHRLVRLLVLEQIVVDHEIAVMCKRIKAGVDCSKEKNYHDDIVEAGPGGHFLEFASTLRACRSDEFFTPVLGDRNTNEQWLELGSPDVYSKATALVADMIARPQEACLPDNVIGKLHELMRHADEHL